MTRNRFVGQLARHTALRQRQQGFLRVLVECAGSRIRAVEASGVPLGTVLRWQSDPWFRERYDEIRAMLARDAEILSAHLNAASIGLALGTYRGLLKGYAMRRMIDGQDEPLTSAMSREEVERQIRELLEHDDWDARIASNTSPPSPVR